MTVRPGLVDDWDPADELESLVGFSSGLNRHTAGPVIRIVQDVKAASLHLTRAMIGVRGDKVILRIPFEKSEPIGQEIQNAGLLANVEIEVVDAPSQFPRTKPEEHRVQKHLF